VEKAALPAGPSVTNSLRIHGYREDTDFNAPMYYYGTDQAFIQKIIDLDSTLGEQIHHLFPYVKGEVTWAVREEMCMTIEDFLARRSRMLFLDAKASVESAPVVADLMAGLLAKDANWVRQQLDEYTLLAKNYLPSINSANR
jgi:glycerol-3-phosphate dehydrogenase